MENINYLRKLLQNYEQYGTSKNIMMTKYVNYEPYSVEPSIVFYENDNNEIVIDSLVEFEKMIKSSYIEYDENGEIIIKRKLPRVLFKIYDEEIIEKIIYEINYSNTYVEKLNGIINSFTKNDDILLKR